MYIYDIFVLCYHVRTLRCNEMYTCSRFLLVDFTKSSVTSGNVYYKFKYRVHSRNFKISDYRCHKAPIAIDSHIIVYIYSYFVYVLIKNEIRLYPIYSRKRRQEKNSVAYFPPNFLRHCVLSGGSQRQSFALLQGRRNGKK